MRGVRIHVVAGLVLGLALTVTPPAAAEPPEFDAVNPNQTEPGPSAQIVGGEPAYVRDHPFVIAMLREGGARPRVAGSGDSALTAPGKSALLLGYGRSANGVLSVGAV